MRKAPIQVVAAIQERDCTIPKQRPSTLSFLQRPPSSPNSLKPTNAFSTSKRGMLDDKNMSFSVHDIPAQLWHLYLDYLWDPSPGSWVSTIASIFRIIAIAIVLPFALLTLFVRVVSFHLRAHRLLFPSVASLFPNTRHIGHRAAHIGLFMFDLRLRACTCCTAALCVAADLPSKLDLRAVLMLASSLLLLALLAHTVRIRRANCFGLLSRT